MANSPNVRAALSFVSRRDLEYGVVYKSDAIADKRVKVIIGDAFENIKKLRKNSQHIIFIDLVDSAVEEKSQVFGSRSKQLFNQIKRCLKDDGVIVCQASPYQKEVLNAFKKHFKKSYGWTDNFDLDSANSFVYAIK